MSLWRRVGVVIAMAVFALTVGASNVFSVDRDGRFFAVGVGKRPCSDYIKFREKKSGCESARGRARAEPYLGADVSSANFRIANPLAEGTASIAVFQLGVQDRVGVS
jgi:hypothetical protein